MDSRFRRRTRIPLYGICGFAILLAARIAWDRAVGADDADRPSTIPSEAFAPLEGWYDVAEVIDGFTLRLVDTRHGRFRLRLIGVQPVAANLEPSRNDAANSHAATLRKATRVTRQFSEKGRVWLRLDRRRLDTDGTLLGYVFDGDKFLNEVLVRAGLATVNSHPADSAPLVRRLQQAQQQAEALSMTE